MAKIKSKTKGAICATVGQAQRVGIFGASGCGKTTKARELIKGLQRVIYFEPLADDIRKLEKEDGFKICVGLHALSTELQKRWQKGFKLAYFPSLDAEEADLSVISSYLMKVQSGYGLVHTAQITLVVDELDLSFPTGISLKMPKNGFKNLCCRGRHTGINIIGLSQRMHLIDNVFRANCNAFYLYRHAEPADIDTGIKILGREYRDEFKNLNNFEYIYKEGQKIFVKK